MSNKKANTGDSIAKGTTYLTAGKVISQIYNFIAIIYVVNRISPEEYALFGICMVVLGFLEYFSDFGLGLIIVQRKNISKKDLDMIFYYIVLVGSCVSLVCYAISDYLEIFFAKPGVAKMMQILCIVILVKSFLATPYRLLVRNHQFQLRAVIDMSSKVASLSCTIILASMGYGVWSLIYGKIINFFLSAIYSYMANPYFPGRPDKTIIKKEFLLFGVNIIGLRFIWYLRNMLDKIIGGKFLNAKEFGYYSFAFNLTKNVQGIIHHVMNIVSVPTLSKLQDNREKLTDGYLELIKYLFLVSAPIFMVGFVCSEEIVKSIFDPKWYHIIFIFKISCVVQIFKLLNSANENLFIASGKPNFPLAMNIVGCVVISIFLFFGKKYGVNGLVLSYLFAIVVFFLFWTYFTLKYFHIPFPAYFKKILTGLVGVLLMILIVFIIKFVFTEISSIKLLSGFSTITLVKVQLVINLLVASMTYLLFIYRFDSSVFKSILESR